VTQGEFDAEIRRLVERFWARRGRPGVDGESVKADPHWPCDLAETEPPRRFRLVRERR
jgi:hypothetical protein